MRGGTRSARYHVKTLAIASSQPNSEALAACELLAHHAQRSIHVRVYSVEVLLPLHRMSSAVVLDCHQMRFLNHCR
jgi:hypothetical protein